MCFLGSALQVCESEMRAGLSSNEPVAISWAFVSQAEIKVPWSFVAVLCVLTAQPGPLWRCQMQRPEGLLKSI